MGGSWERWFLLQRRQETSGDRSKRFRIQQNPFARAITQKRQLWSGEPAHPWSSMIIHDLSSLKATVFSSLRRTRATSFWQAAAWMQRRSKKPWMSWTYYLTIRTVRMLPGTLQITSDYQSLRAKGRLNACCIKSASRVMLVHWCTTWKWLDRPRTAPVNSVSMGETRWNMLKQFSQIRGWQSYRFAQTKTSLWSRFIMECSKQCDRRQDWLHPRVLWNSVDMFRK